MRESSIVRHVRRILVAVVVLFLSGTGTAVAGENGSGANAFQIRPVLGAFVVAEDDFGNSLIEHLLRCHGLQNDAADPSKCSLVVGPVQPPEVFGGLYLLGPARLTAVHVTDARAAQVSGQGAVVDVTLSRVGVRRIDALARRQYTRPPPQNAIAILVDGTVLSVPPFTGERFRDRTVRITGIRSDTEARRIARAIRTARALR